MGSRTMVYILDQTVFCLTMIHHRWEYQDCILITKHVNHFFDIGCCCVWSYPYVASFYVSYSSNGNTSFQKQQSSVHFPLQINKFVIVRFTLVFHSILSISLPLFRYILSHNTTYKHRRIRKYTNLRFIRCYFFPHSLVVIKRERYFDQDTIDERRIFVA